MKYMYSDQINYSWDILINIKGCQGLQNIYSNSHLIVITQDKDSAQIKLDRQQMLKLGQKSLPDKDFILFFQDNTMKKPKVLLQQLENQYAALISIFPVLSDGKSKELMLSSSKKNFLESQDQEQLKEEEIKPIKFQNQRGEFIFIIDRSASMQGTIDQAKSALVLLLQSLPVNSRFNIYSCGSQHKKMFEKGSLDYSEQNIQLAVDETKKMRAKQGGSQLLSCIQSILNQPMDKRYSRSVYVLTDGSIFNPQIVIKQIEQNRGNTKFFSIGHGSGVSKELIDGIAYSGKGKSFYISNNGDQLQNVIKQSLFLAFQPTLQKIHLQFSDGQKVKQISPIFENPPIIRNQQAFTIYALLDKKAFDNQSGAIQAQLSFSDQNKQNFKFNLKIQKSKAIQGSNGILKLFAKSKIDQLVKQMRQVQEQKVRQQLKEKIVQYSLKYQILSRFTTFYGVQNKLNLNVSTPMKEIKIPVSFPDSYCSSAKALTSDISKTFSNWRIYLKFLTRTIVSIEASPQLTILQLKERIWDQQRIIVDRQTLVYQRRVLDNNCNLAFYQIQNQSLLYIIHRVGGIN